MDILLAALPGILAPQTAASWPDCLDAWLFERDPQVRVLKKEYAAGPFPRWNCWIQDPRLARGLAREIALFAPRPGRGRPVVWFVAHSNGACVALLAARRLVTCGFPIGGLLLVGAACEADLARNRVLEWLHRGQLGAAIAYCSRADRVLDGDAADAEPDCSHPLRAARRRLWGLLLRPYGCLGRTGWRWRGAAFPASAPAPAGAGAPAVFIRWFDGGHSAYFEPRHRRRTFELIYQDILACQRGRGLQAAPPNLPGSQGENTSPAATPAATRPEVPARAAELPGHSGVPETVQS